jgi:ankyrin repeat protein
VVQNLTPLHRAASKGHLQVVSYLCEQAANLEATTAVRGFAANTQ